MNNKQVIVRKNIDLLMDGTTDTTYDVIAKDTRIDREVAALTLTLDELEAYVDRLSELVKKEKEQKGGER